MKLLLWHSTTTKKSCHDNTGTPYLLYRLLILAEINKEDEGRRAEGLVLLFSLVLFSLTLK